VSRILAAIASRIPAVDCCPHPDMGDDPDSAYLPAEAIRGEAQSALDKEVA
jgi:hypothetical protein